MAFFEMFIRKVVCVCIISCMPEIRREKLVLSKKRIEFQILENKKLCIMNICSPFFVTDEIGVFVIKNFIIYKPSRFVFNLNKIKRLHLSKLHLINILKFAKESVLGQPNLQCK